MDGPKFDNLARALGQGTSRRTLLRGLAGGFAGVVAGAVARSDRGALARELTICHTTGDPNAPYQTMVIQQAEMNLHARHGDFMRVECCADSDCPNQYGACGHGTCTNGYCVQLPVAAGAPCDPGLACVTGGACDGAFNCTGSGVPVVCPDTGNPCTTSICTEDAGGCQTVPLDDGVACGTNDACISNTCLSGTCVSQDLSDCTGDCADCSGECVDLHADSDNCGTCGHVCEDLGLCLSTTCVPPGICLNSPVHCPGGDQCNTAACDPDTGCYLQPNTGAPCTTAGSNGGTCNANGTCDLMCLPTVTCVVDSDCGAGKHCLNGGCFTEAPIGFCNNACARCFGTAIAVGSSTRVCSDIDFGIGACSTDAQCSPGSYCNPNVGSGNSSNPFLCTRPCPQPAPPV